MIVAVLADKSGSCPSSIFQVLRHFVNDLALGDLQTAAELFAKSSTSPQHETFTPLENESYNKYVYTRLSLLAHLSSVGLSALNLVRVSYGCVRLFLEPNAR